MNFISLPAAPSSVAHQRAVGELDVAFKADGTQTRLHRLFQRGCLKARLPNTFGTPEVVGINISGGIVGGDRLVTRVALAPGTRVTYTTQAAERVYRALGPHACVETKLEVEEVGQMLYLPQETILFDGFALDRALDIDLAAEAEFIGVESLVFGRLAMGEAVRRGALRDRISMRCDGRLLWQDMTRLDGDIFRQLDKPGIGGGARAVASLFAVRKDGDAKLPALRAALAAHHAGVSLRGGVLIARILAPNAARLRQAVVAALDVFDNIRLPRVWQS